MSRAHLVLRDSALRVCNITLSFHRGSTPFWPYLQTHHSTRPSAKLPEHPGNRLRQVSEALGDSLIQASKLEVSTQSHRATQARTRAACSPACVPWRRTSRKTPPAVLQAARRRAPVAAPAGETAERRPRAAQRPAGAPARSRAAAHPAEASLTSKSEPWCRRAAARRQRTATLPGAGAARTRCSGGSFVTETDRVTRHTIDAAHCTSSSRPACPNLDAILATRNQPNLAAEVLAAFSLRCLRHGCSPAIGRYTLDTLAATIRSSMF